MISSSDYNKIMREYEALRIKDRNERDARVDEVYAKVPRIRQLDESRGELALKLVREGGDQSEFAKIAEEKKGLLKANGFPEDYMDLKYECNDCKDTGYIDRKKCHCLIQRENKLLYAQSNIEGILQRENFDTLDESVYSNPEHMSKVVKYCKQYADGFNPEKSRSVLLTGSTGTGKTFLCNSIAKALIDKNYSVIYLTAIELFDAIAQAKIKDNAEMQKLYDRILTCDLLVIDDLGSELCNALTVSNFFFLINHRLQKSRATIISTNLSLEAMRDIYTERVTSRVKSNYDVIPALGNDIRLR